MALLSIAAAWLPPFAMQAVDYVHLSEILYDTPLNEQIVSPPYSNGEYVELYNAGDSVDLSGWLLCGDGSTEQYEFGAVVMPPQSFLIVAYRHARSPEFLLSSLFPGVDEGRVLYQDAIALKNTKEYIRAAVRADEDLTNRIVSARIEGLLGERLCLASLQI